MKKQNREYKTPIGAIPKIVNNFKPKQKTNSYFSIR